MNDALATDHTEYKELDARGTKALFILTKQVFGDGEGSQPGSAAAVIENH